MRFTSLMSKFWIRGHNMDRGGPYLGRETRLATFSHYLKLTSWYTYSWRVQLEISGRGRDDCWSLLWKTTLRMWCVSSRKAEWLTNAAVHLKHETYDALPIFPIHVMMWHSKAPLSCGAYTSSQSYRFLLRFTGGAFYDIFPKSNRPSTHLICKDANINY